MSHLDQHAPYVITVEGHVDETLVDRFGPVNIASVVEDGDRIVSTLSGIVTDQAGVVGLIRHLHGLGIVLLSIERVVRPLKGGNLVTSA
jgi:hypothetical protein